MLLLNSDSLGEQALNKLATLALQNQFNSVRRLDVQVKTDPNLLAQGRLASLAVEGSGLCLTDRTSLHSLQLHLQDIAVSPFKALMGNIELTEPITGSACLVLSETDCEQVLAAQLAGMRVRCQCRADGTLAIALESPDAPAAQFALRPYLCPQRDRATCEAIAGSEALPDSLQASLERCLNLDAFLLPGLSLRAQHLQVQAGQVAIRARARLTHFPSAS